MSDTFDINDRELQDDFELIEVVTGGVDSEGNTILDDSVVVIDAEGTVTAKGETITFETPAGDIMRSELGEDGEMHLTQP